MNPSNAMIFAPLMNTHANDASGAFQPEARAFAKLHGVPNQELHLFDNRAEMADRRAQVSAWMERRGKLADVFALFSHGFKSGVQAGFQLGTISKWAEALKASCVTEPVVLLFCCSTAADRNPATDDTEPGPGGEGGVCDMLRTECLKIGLRPTIYGHTTVGHCTTNPHVRRFLPDETAGGRWLIEPHSELWSRWRRALRTSDLRFRFACLSQAEIEAELRSGKFDSTDVAE